MLHTTLAPESLLQIITLCGRIPFGLQPLLCRKTHRKVYLLKCLVCLQLASIAAHHGDL